MRVRVLLDLEQRLQSWEVALKDVQLPVPTAAEIALVGEQDANLALPSTIREELDFNFEETAAIARWINQEINHEFIFFNSTMNYQRSHGEDDCRAAFNSQLGDGACL